MKLYWGSGSPFAWRAMLALIVKELEFEDQLLQFSKREHKAPDYLALNPRGRVPTLVDGDVVVYESLAIIAYVDRKHPEPPLYGDTSAETARIARIVAEHENYLGRAAYDAAGPIFRGRAAESVESIRTHTAAVATELDRFQDTLGDASWFGGARVSAADLVVYPTLETLDRLAAKPELMALELGFQRLSTSHRGLAAWRDRFRTLRGVARAHPPHWG